MKKITLLVLPFLFSCSIGTTKDEEHLVYGMDDDMYYSKLKTIDLIEAPNGYKRTIVSDTSFGTFLRTLELSNDNTVYYYNKEKRDDQNQYAVIALPLDGELEQCADFVMKLRMLYLRTQNRDIVFYDNENGVYTLSSPYNNFEQYKQTVFGMCGSMSLCKHLQPRDIKDIHIGDVFIRGGFPGHVQIVIDIVENAEGHKMFMLAEGYTPAQSPHIIRNSKDNSPWFNCDESIIASSSYLFTASELMTW